MDAAVERRRSVEAFGLVLLLLLTYVLWLAARGAYDAVVAGPLGLSLTSWRGIGPSALSGWLIENGHFIGALFFFAGFAAYVLRFVLHGAALAFLYTDADESDRRSLPGFLIHVFAILLQLWLLYWIVRAVGDGGSATAIALLVALLLLNALWLGLVYLTAQDVERFLLDDVWKSSLLSGGAAVALFAFEWFRDAGPNDVTSSAYTGANLGVLACALFLLCRLDTILQTRMRGDSIGLTRLIVTLAILGVIVTYGVILVIAAA